MIEWEDGFTYVHILNVKRAQEETILDIKEVTKRKKECIREILRYLTTPDLKADICGPFLVPPYKQTDFIPQGNPASHKTSAICHQSEPHIRNIYQIELDYKLDG